jgi:hypothetical protein
MMKPSEKVYWIKVSSAVVLGILSFIIMRYFNLDGITTLLIGVTIYLALSNLLAMNMGIDNQRGLKIGVGAFLFIWLMAWTLINTLANTWI